MVKKENIPSNILQTSRALIDFLKTATSNTTNISTKEILENLNVKHKIIANIGIDSPIIQEIQVLIRNLITIFNEQEKQETTTIVQETTAIMKNRNTTTSTPATKTTTKNQKTATNMIITSTTTKKKKLQQLHRRILPQKVKSLPQLRLI